MPHKRYESTLRVSQAATGCELQAAERPSPVLPHAAALYACRSAASPAQAARLRLHRACCRAKVHGTRAHQAQLCYTALAARYACHVAASRAHCAPRPANAAPQRVSARRLSLAAI